MTGELDHISTPPPRRWVFVLAVTVAVLSFGGGYAVGSAASSRTERDVDALVEAAVHHQERSERFGLCSVTFLDSLIDAARSGGDISTVEPECPRPLTEAEIRAQFDR